MCLLQRTYVLTTHGGRQLRGVIPGVLGIANLGVAGLYSARMLIDPRGVGIVQAIGKRIGPRGACQWSKRDAAATDALTPSGRTGTVCNAMGIELPLRGFQRRS